MKLNVMGSTHTCNHNRKQRSPMPMLQLKLGNTSWFEKTPALYLKMVCEIADAFSLKDERQEYCVEGFDSMG